MKIKIIKRIICLFSVLTLVLSQTSIIYAYEVPDDMGDVSSYTYVGGSFTDSNFEEHGGFYYYTGSSSPAKHWVKWGSRWCYITEASRAVVDGKTMWDCYFATDEWCLIQTSSGVNKYKLYYFDDNSYLDPSMENGYTGGSGIPIEYNRAGKVLGEVKESALKIQVYDDLEWIEYPEESGHWYYGYLDGVTGYGQRFSLLKDGYAIIQEDDGSYSLYSFDSSYNAHYAADNLKEKDLDYIKSQITTAMNKKPAKFDYITLEMEDFDIGDWEDIDPGITTREINTTPTPNAVSADSVHPDVTTGTDLTVKWRGNRVDSLFGFTDMFDFFRMGDGTQPAGDPYNHFLYSLSENESEASKRLPGTGWRFGDSPMYSFHTYIRMPSAISGGYEENEALGIVSPAQIDTFAPLWWLSENIRTAFCATFSQKPRDFIEGDLGVVWNDINNLDDPTLPNNNTNEDEQDKTGYISPKGEDSPTAIPPTKYKCSDPKNHEKTHVPSHKKDEEEPESFDGCGTHKSWSTYEYDPTGQLQCEGTANISVDLSPLEFLSDGLYLRDNNLVFEDRLNQYAAPDQHGKISALLNSREIDTAELEEDMTDNIQPWHVFGTGQQFGFEYPKVVAEGTPVTDILETSSINIVSNAKYFYPHLRMRYRSMDNFSNWYEVYMVSRKMSTMQDNILVKVSANPVTKPTLHVDSVWDGWANTINGLVKNGVTRANGDDRDVVVDGGSTMYISTKQTEKTSGKTGNDDVDVAKLGVTVYINSCYGNEQNFTPYDEKGFLDDTDGWNWYTGSGYTTENYDAVKSWTERVVGAGFFPIVSGQKDDYFLGDELPAFKMSQRNSKWYNKTGNKVYKMTEAAQAIQNFFNDMQKNLGHYKLEKVMAEGLFKQGQEEQFDMVAKTVSGVNAVDHFGSFGQGNKAYNESRTERTANVGNKLNTDAKYQLTNYYGKNSESNTIGVSCDYADIHTFWAEIDIHDQDNEAILKIGKDGHQDQTIKLSEYKPNNILQVQKLLNKLGNEWTELEIDTGFLRNLLTTTLHQLGEKSTRPAAAAIGGDLGTRPYGSKWYNEGVPYFFIVRGQAQYTLKLNEEKMEVMDPNLCGLAENNYDLRNWNPDEDESYTVGGVKIPLKNKVRTFRYQLSPNFSYEGVDPEKIPKNNATAASEGDMWYLGRIQHPLKDTWDEGLADVDDEGDDGGTHEGASKYFPAHMAELVDEYYVDVFCQKMDFALKSKLMYLTNATVQDNNK